MLPCVASESADADGRPMPSPIGLDWRVAVLVGGGAASRVSWIDGCGWAESAGVKSVAALDRVDCEVEAAALADSGREKLGVEFGEMGVDMVMGPG